MPVIIPIDRNPFSVTLYNGGKMFSMNLIDASSFHTGYLHIRAQKLELMFPERMERLAYQ